MASYRNAEKKDRLEIIDLMNYVFKVDFEKVLPKTFNENFEFEKITKVAEDKQGKLIAEVCVLPQQVTVGENSLDTNFLGGVTVHPRYRGQQHMITLINMWLEEMKGNCDMSVLGGLRQRYEHFGYTPGGVQWEYLVNRHNVAHGLKNIATDTISIKPMAEADDAFELAAKLNNIKNVNVYRDCDCADKIMVCYRQHPFAVLENGEFIGYVVTSLDRSEISEFVLYNGNDTKKVIKAYVEHFATEKIKVVFPDYEKEYHREMMTFAEEYKTGFCCNFNIFNFAKVIREYLELKNQTHKLSFGKFSAVMDNQPITVTIDENGVTVEEKAVENAIVMDKLDAQELLLTNAGRYMDIDVPGDWFPLPLFWHKVDQF